MLSTIHPLDAGLSLLQLEGVPSLCHTSLPDGLDLTCAQGLIWYDLAITSSISRHVHWQDGRYKRHIVRRIADNNKIEILRFEVLRFS